MQQHVLGELWIFVAQVVGCVDELVVGVDDEGALGCEMGGDGLLGQCHGFAHAAHRFIEDDEGWHGIASEAFGFDIDIFSIDLRAHKIGDLDGLCLAIGVEQCLFPRGVEDGIVDGAVDALEFYVADFIFEEVKQGRVDERGGAEDLDAFAFIEV